MKRIILMIIIGSIALSGCGIRNKNVKEVKDESKDVIVEKDISEIETVLKDLDQLEVNLDDIADEDLVSE